MKYRFQITSHTVNHMYKDVRTPVKDKSNLADNKNVTASWVEEGSDIHKLLNLAQIIRDIQELESDH